MGKVWTYLTPDHYSVEEFPCSHFATVKASEWWLLRKAIWFNHEFTESTYLYRQNLALDREYLFGLPTYLHSGGNPPERVASRSRMELGTTSIGSTSTVP